MDSVKRYDMSDNYRIGVPDIEEVDGGCYVTHADYLALAAERDGLRKDAMRYRYFREFGITPEDVKADLRTTGFRQIIADELDAAIDAAIAESAKDHPPAQQGAT